MPKSTSKPKGRPKRKGRGRQKPAALPANQSTAHLPKDIPERVRQALAACTIPERKFIVAYVGEARGNGALAVELAKITSSGTSVFTRSTRATQLLQIPRVRRAVDTWFDATGITAAQLTASLVDLSTANLSPFLKWDPATRLLTVEVPDAPTWELHKHWIKRIKADKRTGRVTEIEVHDALAAKRELAKILRLYSDAPIMNAHFHYYQMTDDEIQAEWDRLEASRRRDAEGEVMPESVRITSGEANAQ